MSGDNPSTGSAAPAATDAAMRAVGRGASTAIAGAADYQRPLVRAFLGMGTNLGDRRRYLLDAVAAIPEIRAVSPLYETDPVGGPEQGAYLNIVVELATRRTPRQLLELCHELEQAAERVREVRWGPRTLDVDVLWVDGVQLDDLELTIPHPRAHQRNFVMRPLLDLDPTLEMPGWDPDEAFGDVENLGPLV